MFSGEMVIGLMLEQGCKCRPLPTSISIKTTTTKSHVDFAALRGSRVKSNSFYPRATSSLQMTLLLLSVCLKLTAQLAGNGLHLQPCFHEFFNVLKCRQ